MTIKTKLLIYFSILFVLSLTTTTVVYFFLRTLPKSIVALESSHNRLDFVSRLQITIERSLMPPNDFLTHGDVQERKNYEVLNDKANAMFDTAEKMDFSVEGRHIIEHVKGLYANVENIASEILALKYPRLRVKNVADRMEEMDAIAEEAVDELDRLNAKMYEKEIINLHKVSRLFFYAECMTITSLLFTIVFGFCICVVCVRTFTKPLDKIFSGVRDFSNNNFVHHINIKSPYEFQQLATELNRMSQNILTAHSRLEENRQVWEDTFDTITDAVSIQDKDYNLINVNNAYTKIVNMSKEELIGKKCYEIVHCTEGPIENCPAAKAFDTEEPQIVDLEEKRFNAWFHLSAFPMRKQNGACTGVVHIIRDITEQKKIEKELEDYRVDLERKVEERTYEIKELLMGAVKAMAIAIDKKSPWTADHSIRVSRYSTSIARALNANNELIERVRITSLLHDIGKIGVPDDLLNSTERLGEEQLSIIREHTVYGADIIKNVKHFEYAISGIMHHHEFYNGKGTPYGLNGEGIPFVARIIAVADAYDAMTSERPYRRRLSHEEAVEELQKGMGTQFDPQIVEAFLQSLNILLKT